MERYTSIRPGQPWLDTNGQRIQAHGGNVLYHKGRFYWYGENKEKSQSEYEIWHWGVRMYSSVDLYNWEDEGIICMPEPEHPESPMHPQSKMDRPHILYDDKKDRFVMWMKIMTPHPYFMVAVSKDITGPFTLLHKVQPCGFGCGDFDLVKDPATGKAVVVFERVHSSMIVMDLNEDYTDVAGYYTEHLVKGRPPFVREAPALFQKDGKWWMFTSGTTAKFPNPTETAVAETLHGPWTELGITHVNDVKKTSFDSQISAVLQHPDHPSLYIALADRWLIDLKPDLPDMWAVFDSWFDPKKEDLISKDIRLLTAKNTAMADYVWLPVQFKEDGTPYLEWMDEWRIEDFI